MSAITSNVSTSPAFQERFRFIKPTLPPLADVLTSYSRAYEDRLITNGRLVAQLESDVKDYLQVDHCVAVSSCTSGLMMVIRALGLTGEIILPSFTFFATGHAAVWNGLTPVFAECDARTWNIDPVDVERKITDKTTAIIAVHMYGNPCSIDTLEQVAARHRLVLIFDAAHAFGSTRQGRKIGGFGKAEVFSLSPTKLLVAGEGGLVTTSDPVLAHQIKAARNYGDLGAYDPELVGLNARMSEFNAALAIAGLPLIEQKLKRHNEIALLYSKRLKGIRGVSFQHIEAEDTSTYKDFSIVINTTQLGLSRDDIADRLLEENIETKKYFYPPMHRQARYRKYYNEDSTPLPQTERVSGGVLSLPIYESLSDDTVIRIADTIRAICA